MSNITKILTLLDEGIKIKNAISKEINKERDAKRRKKIKKLCRRALDSGLSDDLAALRDILFKL